MRYVFGPVSRRFADDHLASVRSAGECLAFDWGPGADLAIRPDDAWESFAARWPGGWRPEFIALYLPYRTIPDWLWVAPVPLVGLAGDWNLLWHCYRRQLRRCELVLVDTEGAERLEKGMRDEGVKEVGSPPIHIFNMYGAPAGIIQSGAETAHSKKDIDILFVGNFNPCVQRERLPLLARLARMAEKYRVVGARGDSLPRRLAGQRLWNKPRQLVFRTGTHDIYVLELGIGVGLFARFFLDHFRELCRKHGKDYYDRLC